MTLGLIKACPNPHCDAVWHNCPKEQKHCKDCGNNIKIINEDTFWKKFSNNFFQYDYSSGDFFRPEKQVDQIPIEF